MTDFVNVLVVFRTQCLTSEWMKDSLQSFVFQSHIMTQFSHFVVFVATLKSVTTYNERVSKMNWLDPKTVIQPPTKEKETSV